MASFNSQITTAVQLHNAETATYLTDAVIGIVFIILIMIVANMIDWKPGLQDTSPAKRRTWFWILGVVNLFVCLIVNYFAWMRHISKDQFVDEYLIHMIVASFASALFYGLVSFVICKMQKKDTKLASVFK